VVSSNMTRYHTETFRSSARDGSRRPLSVQAWDTIRERKTGYSLPERLRRAMRRQNGDSPWASHRALRGDSPHFGPTRRGTLAVFHVMSRAVLLQHEDTVLLASKGWQASPTVMAWSCFGPADAVTWSASAPARKR
jgi:hypothetical protein